MEKAKWLRLKKKSIGFVIVADMWKKTNDYYNREVVTCDVWSRKIRRGMLYLQDKEPYQYTVSCGASSEYSHTGSFFGCSKIDNLDTAKEVLDKIVPMWLDNVDYTEELGKYK